MFKRLKLNRLDDFFISSSMRTSKGIYSVRLISYNDEIEKFLYKYTEYISKNGIHIRDKLSNPSENHLLYFNEIIGREFRLDSEFLMNSLKRWLPALTNESAKSISDTTYMVLKEYSDMGKVQNILLNAYIKFMCWLYYKFQPILSGLGNEELPKIIYEGSISDYELKMLYILSSAGCDIVLFDRMGDNSYLKIDNKSRYSELIAWGREPFPKEFTIDNIKKRVMEINSIPKLQLQKPQKPVSTNTWLSGDLYSDSVIPQSKRSDNQSFVYNMFVSIWGADDKNTYYNELVKWKLKLESLNKKVFICENGFRAPDNSEVSRINRKNYLNEDHLIFHMVSQITVKNIQLVAYVKYAFVNVIQQEINIGMQKLLNTAVMLICWINRYIPEYFGSGQSKEINTLIYYGQCTKRNEILFLYILSQMPIDILIINPDLSKKTEINSKLYFEKKYDISLPIEKFPIQLDNTQFGTVAYHAQQDLNTILYEDTGMYRNRQFKKAIPITLQTTYDEIKILWKQEAVYRPNFEILDEKVMLPVIFSKISGVEGSIENYLYEISDLCNNNTLYYNKVPFNLNQVNPFKDKVYSLIKEGKVLVNKIRDNNNYKYSFIREDMQDYMFDKLQHLIDKRIIKGTGTSGTEYTILATILNLDKSILRMIQKYDFTKEIPKILIVQTDESKCSIEDSITVAYLNLIGFDIGIFVPTGYRSIEQYFASNILLEHQVGEYIYDLQAPDLHSLKRKKESIAGKLFRRGR